MFRLYHDLNEKMFRETINVNEIETHEQESFTDVIKACM
jgi:hypothetical protein